MRPSAHRSVCVPPALKYYHCHRDAGIGEKKASSFSTRTSDLPVRCTRTARSNLISKSDCRLPSSLTYPHMYIVNTSFYSHLASSLLSVRPLHIYLRCSGPGKPLGVTTVLLEVPEGGHVIRAPKSRLGDAILVS